MTDRLKQHTALFRILLEESGRVSCHAATDRKNDAYAIGLTRDVTYRWTMSPVPSSMTWIDLNGMLVSARNYTVGQNVADLECVKGRVNGI